MLRGADDPTELAGRLYDQYGTSLYRYALMLLADPSAAEDVVQQVFASLMSVARRNATIDNAEHYLRRAIRNECYSTLRRKSRDAPRSAFGEAFLQPVTGAERPDDRLALERALRALPPEQREVVHLRVYEGMTFQEIASQTDEFQAWRGDPSRLEADARHDARRLLVHDQGHDRSVRLYMDQQSGRADLQGGAPALVLRCAS